MKFTPAVKNPHPMPEALKPENIEKLRPTRRIELWAQNGLNLHIDEGGWAFWSNSQQESPTARFEEYYYEDDLYLAYPNPNGLSFLSFSDNDYVGVYNWTGARSWVLDPLRVKNEGRHTYEYEKDGKLWVVVGNYDYPLVDLYAREV